MGKGGGPLAQTDYGRAYTDEEKAEFATLIMYQELTNIDYGHFKTLRAWPGIVGSVLLELQRAARRENPADSMCMHQVFHMGDGGKKGAVSRQARARKGIHDDATEARLCELAWDWPSRRTSSEVRIKTATAVPALMSKNTTSEFRLSNTMDRNMGIRQLRVRNEARPPLPNAPGADFPPPEAVFERLVSLAFVEYKFCADPVRGLTTVLSRAALSLDTSSADARAGAAYAAAYVSDLQWAARHRGLKTPPWSAADAAACAKHLALLKFGQAKKAKAARRRPQSAPSVRAEKKRMASGQRRMSLFGSGARVAQDDSDMIKANERAATAEADWDPASMARRGPAGVIGALLERGDVAAKAAACAAVADASRYCNGACDYGIPNSALLVECLRSNAAAARRNHVAKPTCELVPILAAAAVASMCLQAPDSVRGPLVNAGAVEALTEMLRAAMSGAKSTAGCGNATPSAVLIPRHAIAALCALCDDADVRRRARSSGALTAVARVLSIEIDNRNPICRIAHVECLRFVSYYMLFDKASDVLGEAVVPGILRLTRAPEGSIRRASVRTLLYVVMSIKRNPAFLLRTTFLHSMKHLMTHFSLRGELLRIMLVVAKHRDAAAILIADGFVDILYDVVEDYANPAANRSIGCRILFTMGQFEIFESGIAQKSAKKDKGMRLEIAALEKLIEERAMQLAYKDRPLVEQKYTKIELKNYKNMFNEASEPGPPRAVVIFRLRQLLRDCCTIMRDTKTKRWMTQRNVNRIVSIFDADGSGMIEWAEFLEIFWSLREKSITGLVRSFFADNIFGFDMNFMREDRDFSRKKKENEAALHERSAIEAGSTIYSNTPDNRPLPQGGARKGGSASGGSFT